MNDFIIIIFCLAFSVLSFFLGNYISKLKVKAEHNSIKDENLNLKSTIEKNTILEHENLQNLKNAHEIQINHFKEQLYNTGKDKDHLVKEKEELLIELTKLDSDFKNLQQRYNQQKQELTQLQVKFSDAFQNLANQILEEKSEKFLEINNQNLKSILEPLQEKILLFEKKVDDTHKASIDHNASLRAQIISLKDLNLKMSKEALDLTKALKGDNKLQGNWGELVLEKVLEKSGLEKDREFFVQKSFSSENGKRLVPDVVINLPENKKMIVDSKVSLVAYERFINEGDKTLQDNFLTEHIISIQKHVDQLSAKNYQDLYKVDSPDFVLMFVPIESAFAVALNKDNTLYNKAFERNIVIVTPTTLLATLRTIDSMWNNEKQQKNAIEIARQAGAMYDKFHNLMNDLANVGRDIDKAKGSYTAAMNKLFEGKGNLVNSVEKIKKLGAKAKKTLPNSIIDRANESI